MARWVNREPPGLRLLKRILTVRQFFGPRLLGILCPDRGKESHYYCRYEMAAPRIHSQDRACGAKPRLRLFTQPLRRGVEVFSEVRIAPVQHHERSRLRSTAFGWRCTNSHSKRAIFCAAWSPAQKSRKGGCEKSRLSVRRTRSMRTPHEAVGHPRGKHADEKRGQTGRAKVPELRTGVRVLGTACVA